MIQIPTVSVIIPAYNCENYIAQALDSVRSQTHTQLEILVIDDCSTDGTMSVIEPYLFKDKRIQLFRNKKNLGVALSRNRGLEASTGDFVAFLDADDFWYPRKLEKQLRCIERYNVQVSYTSYDIIGADGRPVKKPYIVPEHADIHKLYGENIIGLSSSLITRKIASSYRMNPDYYCEDYIFWLDILGDGHRAAGVPEVLTAYRLLESGRSHDKQAAAKLRWEMLRQYAKLPLPVAAWYFMQYAAKGVKKYH